MKSASAKTVGLNAFAGSKFWQRRGPVVVGILIWASAFGLYLMTLAPSVVTFEVASYDATHLQTVAYVLGIGHPTGYPTFVMLGKLFTYLPVGEVAYRVNLSSALYGSLAVLAVYMVSLRLTGGRVLAAAAGGVSFGLTEGLWSQSVIAEVYSLNALFIGATFYVFLLWRDTKNDRYLVLGAFLCGLSLTNHLTSGLLVPSAFIFVWLVDRRRFLDAKLLAKCALVFSFGLLPYLYLPLRAFMNPPLLYADTSNLKDFLWFITGGSFKGQMFAFGPAQLPERFTRYLIDLSEQFPFIALVAAVVGIGTLFIRDRAAFALLGFFGCATLFYALEYSILDIAEYFLPTYLVLAIAVSAGVMVFEEILFGVRDRRVEPGTLAFRAGYVVFGVAALMLVFAPHFYTTYRDVDLSDEWEGRAILEALGDTVPENSIVLNNRNKGIIYHAAYVYPGIPGLDTSDAHQRLLEHARDALETGRPVYVLDPTGPQLGELETGGFEVREMRRLPDGGAIYALSR